MHKKTKKIETDCSRVLTRGLIPVFLLIFRRRCLSSRLPYDMKLIEGLYLTSTDQVLKHISTRNKKNFRRYQDLRHQLLQVRWVELYLVK